MGEPILPPCRGFVSAEGRYHLLEDIILGDPLTSGTLGTSISLLSMKFKEPKKNPPMSSSSNVDNNNEENNINPSGRDSPPSPIPPATSPADPIRLGESNGVALFAPGPRRKSKPAVAKTNSSLVARIVAHEQLAERLLQAMSKATYVFYASGRTFLWADLHHPKVYINTDSVSLLNINLTTIMLFRKRCLRLCLLRHRLPVMTSTPSLGLGIGWM